MTPQTENKVAITFKHKLLAVAMMALMVSHAESVACMHTDIETVRLARRDFRNGLGDQQQVSGESCAAGKNKRARNDRGRQSKSHRHPPRYLDGAKLSPNEKLRLHRACSESICGKCAQFGRVSP